MKRFVVLGGTGAMGSVVVKDLFATCKNCEIIIAATDGAKAKAYARSFKSRRVKGIEINVKNINATARILRGADACINCVVYYLNLDVMKACLKAGVHYLDLGGLFHMTKKQLKLNDQFKRKKLIAILGCGSTPGITNVMAGYGARFFNEIDEVHISFGDKDYTKYDQPFVLPYTIYTLFDEFMMKPALFTKGKLKMIEPMSGEKILEFPKPVGKVNGFYTLHSELATFPSSFKSKGIRECSFRVTFPEEFRKQIKFLIDTGFASDRKMEFNGCEHKPKHITVKIMDQWLPKKETKINDLEYVMVEIIGKIRGKKKRMILDCFNKTNRKWNIQAGTWNTAVPPSIIAQMIADKQIKTYGVLPPERCVNPELFFKELRKRDIRIFNRINYN